MIDARDDRFETLRYAWDPDHVAQRRRFAERPLLSRERRATI